MTHGLDPPRVGGLGPAESASLVPTLRFLVLMGFALLLGSPARALANCERDLRVVQAGVTFQTRLFQGKPTRRDGLVEVVVRSTSTVSISQIDLGIFLGVSLEDVEQTRAAALPTKRTRAFPNGGIAFQASVDMLIPPGSKRSLKITKRALPMDADLYAITAKIADCQVLVSVGEATIRVPHQDRSGPSVITWAALGLSLLIIGMIVARLFR